MANVERPFLGWIEADFCNQVLTHMSQIFRDLQDYHSFAPLHTQIFVNFSFLFLQFFPPNFIIFCEFWINFTCFRADFDENLSEFHGIEKCFTKFRRNLKFWRIRGEGVAKKVEIISAKSLIFRSGGWPVLFSRARGHVILSTSATALRCVGVVIFSTRSLCLWNWSWIRTATLMRVSDGTC